MDKTSSRTLDFTVLSAENLRLDRKPVKKNAFVVVKVDPLDPKSTTADCSGGSNPTWNEKLEINLPVHARFLTLEVKCRTGSGDRLIGTVGVPVSDFIGDYKPENYLHLLSYRLRDSRGERNGIINVSVKVDTPCWASNSAARMMGNNSCAASSSSSSLPPVMWQRMTVGVPAEKSQYGGVVTGVPVWCAPRA